MEAILNNQQGETFFKAGGDMHHPDKEVSLHAEILRYLTLMMLVAYVANTK